MSRSKKDGKGGGGHLPIWGRRSWFKRYLRRVNKKHDKRQEIKEGLEEARLREGE